MRKPTRTHKFRIGQTLEFTQTGIGADRGRFVRKIVQLLPLEAGEPQYRVKCTNEPAERVVKEYSLVRRL